MQYPFTKEQLELAERVRSFMEQEVAPVATEIDARPDPRDCYPKELINKASKLGLRTIAVPKEYGGLGAGMIEKTLALWTGAQIEISTPPGDLVFFGELVLVQMQIKHRFLF